ncbi:MAG: alpha-L-rhamnosidase [Fimbriimonas sp.]
MFPRPLDLAPAHWIWFPSRRTLANTFVLFRREFDLAELPAEAKGWIAADSRYRLTVNGRYVQWGPAPHDPRHAEADPVDLAPYLRPGRNCIGVEVLFYGHGEGTWPFGKPGLLMKVGDWLTTDGTWRCRVDRAHRPGQYRRWFLRSLQEEFDARLHPYGWDEAGFDDGAWIDAMEFRNPPSRAAFAGAYSDYATEAWHLHPEASTLTERSVPMLTEEWRAGELRFVNSIKWRRDPADWFEFRTPGAFAVGSPQPTGEVLPPTPFIATYELDEEVVGWPAFTIDAPEGTVVELMIQESHDHASAPWLDTHHYAWSRFICREGENRFQTFDYEAGRWLQLHVHGHTRPVTIREVGIVRRQQPWPNEARIRVDEPALQRLFDASINTLHNSAQETIVDGMGRERQQYAGDGSHQLHALRYAFGDVDVSARYLRTFAQGQMVDGVFADSWPAVDRLMRLWQRNVDASDWGPLIDHSVGFVFDHYHHWMQTGDLEPARENMGRIHRFVHYLRARGKAGLMRVEGLEPNAVWVDHDAFPEAAAKVCAFNLYVVAMLREAYLPLHDAVGPQGEHFELADDFHTRLRREAVELSQQLMDLLAERCWDAERGLYGSYSRYERQGKAQRPPFRADDRSLATAVLYDLCPGGQAGPSVEALATRPEWMGQSYPCNYPWNYWALAKAGRIQVVIDDLRERWATMRSVTENNTLQEHWHVTPDTTSLMSHCPLAPLTALYQGILGLLPLRPGFAEMSVRPQLGDLREVDLTAYTPVGPVRLQADTRRIVLDVPRAAEVIWPDGMVRVGAGRTEWKR